MDEGCAIRDFNGKSFEQAVTMFKNSALTYSEDLMYMTPIPLNFYMSAYEHYLESYDSRGDCDGAACYLSLILHLTKFQWNTISARWKFIIITVNHIANNQKHYDADVDIYGDFLEIKEKIKIKAAQQGDRPEPVSGHNQ